MDEDRMIQTADFPKALALAVRNLKYKPGFTFSLEHIDRGQGSVGLTFIVRTMHADAYHPDVVRGVLHYFIVPAAAYTLGEWERWIFDRLGDIDTHERGEWFQTPAGRPFAPNHGPGMDPYIVRMYSTDEDRRTSFRGEVKPT